MTEYLTDHTALRSFMLGCSLDRRQ
jgi:hypothetical protein